MEKCSQCSTCENSQIGEDGIWCMILQPSPQIINDKCYSYEKIAGNSKIYDIVIRRITSESITKSIQANSLNEAYQKAKEKYLKSSIYYVTLDMNEISEYIEK